MTTQTDYDFIYLDQQEKYADLKEFETKFSDYCNNQSKDLTLKDIKNNLKNLL